MSQAALIVCSLELALWSYTIFAEARGLLSQQSYYGSWISYVGLIGSITGVAISVLAEGKLRRYLLICTVGLLGFFCFGAGEAI